MKIRGAIFDMDGILFDTERVYQETWREIADERHIRLEDGFTKAICGSTGEYMRHVVEKYYQVSDGYIIIDDCMARVRKKLSVNVPMKDGVQEILNFFREKDIRMAVASSSYMQQIESNLGIAGIRGYFHEIVSGTEIINGKPAPDIFLCAAKKIGCDPGECLVFEDSENGVKAGHAAGCITIMIPDMIEPSSEIIPCCSKIYPSFTEVLKEMVFE